MRASIRLALSALVLTGIARTAPAQETTPIPAIRADRWADARAAADRYPDPVGRKVVEYYRLLAPGAATAPEIAAFVKLNPDWPAQALLERRRQEAIVTEPDQATALGQCSLAPPTQAATMLRCADAIAIAGRTGEANALARKAWVDTITDAGQEGVFLRRWTGITTAEDEWARFDRLAWRDTTAAARQLGRVDAARQPAGEVRLALRRDDASADAGYAALPAARRDDPGMVLDRARYLRRTSRTAEAVALWDRSGIAAQRAAPDHLGDFWSERHVLTRRLLRDGDAASAYRVVAGHGQVTPENLVEAEFLAGFIALRMLKDPAKAERHFQTLKDSSKAAITQGRALYWLGRTAAARGADPTQAWRAAAAWGTTFYGQMAAVSLGEDPVTLNARITALRDPAWDQGTVFAFTGHEVVRAAMALIAWGDAPRARAFLLRMDDIAPVPAERSVTAEFALRVGLPDTAVFVARRVGRDGGMLPQAGWPMPFDPPADFDPAIALGIMRQESSFDIGAISSSGARGLMQLMPFTARDVAKKLNIPTSLPMLTSDTGHNMRLGTTYLRDMLARFGGSLPLATAAYNAGPHRVDQWLGENGDPRSGPIEMIDWMELIPFSETRNYVQRVLENVVIYRARRGEPVVTLDPRWAR